MKKFEQFGKLEHERSKPRTRLALQITSKSHQTSGMTFKTYKNKICQNSKTTEAAKIYKLAFQRCPTTHDILKGNPEQPTVLVLV